MNKMHSCTLVASLSCWAHTDQLLRAKVLRTFLLFPVGRPLQTPRRTPAPEGSVSSRKQSFEVQGRGGFQEGDSGENNEADKVVRCNDARHTKSGIDEDDMPPSNLYLQTHTDRTTKSDLQGLALKRQRQLHPSLMPCESSCIMMGHELRGPDKPRHSDISGTPLPWNYSWILVFCFPRWIFLWNFWAIFLGKTSRRKSTKNSPNNPRFSREFSDQNPLGAISALTWDIKQSFSGVKMRNNKKRLRFSNAKFLNRNTRESENPLIYFCRQPSNSR